jgi:Helix-hairpin-helix domain
MDREATGLRRITGIGAATARTLHESGVRTLEDLAGRSTEELAGITGKSQRTVQEWQARARALTAAEEPKPAEPGPAEPGPVEPDRQRSETFTIEVRLNEDDTVRYVRAEHVPTDARHARESRAETTSWSDWQSAERELAGFLLEHAGLPAAAAGVEPATEAAPAGPRVRRLATIPSLAGAGEVMPSEDTPFTLRLPVTLAQLGLAPDDRLDYQATVVAKRLGQPRRQEVGTATGTAAGDDAFDVLLECAGLPAGTYRLEAVLRLEAGGKQVIALLENALLEVRPEPGRRPAPGQATVVQLR